MSSYVDDLIKQAMEQKPSKYLMVKLPCCSASVQINRTGDQYITCPNCGRHSALTWALQPKITTEVPDGHDRDSVFSRGN